MQKNSLLILGLLLAALFFSGCVSEQSVKDNNYASGYVASLLVGSDCNAPLVIGSGSRDYPAMYPKKVKNDYIYPAIRMYVSIFPNSQIGVSEGMVTDGNYLFHFPIPFSMSLLIPDANELGIFPERTFWFYSDLKSIQERMFVSVSCKDLIDKAIAG